MSIEDLDDHLDLSFARDLIRRCYSPFESPSIDPAFFFRLQLCAFLEGIRPKHLPMSVAAVRLSMRWYRGYDLCESLPNHSTDPRSLLPAISSSC